MRASAIFFVLAFAFAQNAEFIAGYEPSESKIWVLCENETSAFVAGPQGFFAALELDSSWQASIEARIGGSYVVQCGKQTKSVKVPSEKASPGIAPESDGIEMHFLPAFLLLFAAALYFFLSQLFLPKTSFLKMVEKGKVRLFLHAGKKMENIAIRDPAHAIKERQKEFFIPLLEQGSSWQAQYPACGDEAGEPAELEAACEGKKLKMLSQLAGFPEKSMPAKKVQKAGA